MWWAHCTPLLPFAFACLAAWGATAGPEQCEGHGAVCERGATPNDDDDAPERPVAEHPVWSISCIQGALLSLLDSKGQFLELQLSQSVALRALTSWRIPTRPIIPMLLRGWDHLYWRASTLLRTIQLFSGFLTRLWEMPRNWCVFLQLSLLGSKWTEAAIVIHLLHLADRCYHA